MKKTTLTVTESHKCSVCGEIDFVVVTQGEYTRYTFDRVCFCKRPIMEMIN